MDLHWANITGMTSVAYRCGHCGQGVASSAGYYTNDHLEGDQVRIYVCPHCAMPSIFHGEWRMPDVAPGDEVAGVPNEVYSLYREARNCVAASAYTSAVLACRKLLMNIGVSQGAAEGSRFIEYVDYLANHGFVPPNGRGWVDHIRKKGNEATHEIVLMGREDAEELIAFAEMLLKFIYEFPSKVPGAKSP